MSKKNQEPQDLGSKFDRLGQTMKEDGDALYESLMECGPVDEDVLETLNRQNDVIKEKANILSLLYLIERVKNEEGKARTLKGHAKRTPARDFVVAEWIAHREDYGHNKTDFAKHYEKRVLNEFDVKVSDKTIREVWIKGAT